MECSTTYKDGYDQWPDTYLGSSEYYAVDCNPYLTNEGDTLDNVDWVVPIGLTEEDRLDFEGFAYIKLKGDVAGTHTILFKLNSSEGAKTQLVQGRFRLKVVNI